MSNTKSSAGPRIHFPSGTSEGEKARASKALDRDWPEHFRAVAFIVPDDVTTAITRESPVTRTEVIYSYARLILQGLDLPEFKCPLCGEVLS